MAWDADRPVPWQRLVREWLVYVAIMAAVFALFFRDRNLVGVFAGLLASGPMYLAFGFAMAKLGYQRRPIKGSRAEPKATTQEQPGEPAQEQRRAKPPPTKRTGGGGSQRPGGARRKRR